MLHVPDRQRETEAALAEAMAILEPTEPTEPYYEFHGPYHQTPSADEVLAASKALLVESYILLTEEGIDHTGYVSIDQELRAEKEKAEKMARALRRFLGGDTPYFDDRGVQC